MSIIYATNNLMQCRGLHYSTMMGDATVLAASLEERLYSAVLVAHSYVRQWGYGYGWWDRPVSYAQPCDRRPVALPLQAHRVRFAPGASGKRTRQTLKLHQRRG